MFVFFDRNGVVREIINDKPMREGNVKANRIYCYFDEINPYDVFITIQWADLVKTNETSFIENVVEMAVPYNKDKDYKFFKDFKKYKFYYFDIENVSSEGLASATVRIMEDNDSLFSQGIIAFYVENSVIKTDYQITQAQYDYLISLIARNNLEIKSIKYIAEKVTPTSVEAIPDFNSLKIHAKDNFSVDKMTEFENSDNIEDMWYGCGIDTEETVGFSLYYDNAQIGKIQLLINGNEYGKEFNLKCYAYINGEKELVDTLIVPPMKKGVFAYLRFDVYGDNITQIDIVQEEDWTKDRFYVKAIESFDLSGDGKYIITQKNGIVSEIDNPDTNWLDYVYDYVNEQMNYIRENIGSVQENTQFVQEAFDYIRPAYEDIKAFENDLDVRQTKIEKDLTDATNTLTQINSQLDQPNGFASLGYDGKIKASQLPFEKIVNTFAISNSDDLITLEDANIGDIAYIIENGKVTYNYRLIAEPYSVKSNWLLQSTTFTSNSAYADTSGLADNSSAVNGIAFKKIKLADYNKLTDKTGTYLVVLE